MKNLFTTKSEGLMETMFETLRTIGLDARAKVQKIDASIVEIDAQRAKLDVAPPHADDLAEWVCINIDRHRDYFLERAATYLHPHTIQQRGWSALDDPELRSTGFGIFRMDNNIAISPKGYLGPIDRDAIRNDPIDPRALVALLAEPLKAAAKDFILRLLPESVNGMRRAERDRQIQALSDARSALVEQRTLIVDELSRVGGVIDGTV